MRLEKWLFTVVNIHCCHSSKLVITSLKRVCYKYTGFAKCILPEIVLPVLECVEKCHVHISMDSIVNGLLRQLLHKLSCDSQWFKEYLLYMNRKQITFSQNILIVNNGYTATQINEYGRNERNNLKRFWKKKKDENNLRYQLEREWSIGRR
jgi:hypothetical protein